MQSDEFLVLAQELFGDDWAWVLHKRLDLNIRTIKRMGSGKRPIPQPIAEIMKFWIGARYE